MKLRNGLITALVIFLFIFIILPAPAFAYIGPGAGFALLSSLFALLISFFLAFVSLLTLPFRLIIQLFKRKKAFAKAKTKRLVVLGLDGLDPQLCDRFMARGLMPNLKKLRDKGSYHRLGSTYPSLSPVAWSTFSTGTNPAKHNIYDFLVRNTQTYLPELSSSRVGSAKKTVKIGKYRIPLGKPTVTFLRRSKSFWKILGEHGIFSHIIRVPITFPPEKFKGAMLSAMCTPDIRGTQGSFSHYTTAKLSSKYTGGTRLRFEKNGDSFHAELIGPENSLKEDEKPLNSPFSLQPLDDETARLVIGKKEYTLKRKQMSDWIPVTFKAGWIKVHGIAQFYLKQLGPETELYVSPINIDPERPALPVSHPYFFAVYLAKLFGKYSTLGLAEDTWALNEEVLDEKAFLEQAYKLFDEREEQFFHALKKTKKGVCAVVFDGTDRIQHMFFRYLVEDHPANRGKDKSLYEDTILQLYQKADNIVGKTLDKISDDTLLLVMSDHGFKSFVRGVNLNAWLYENGYLALKNKDFSVDYFQNVDWSKTKAYAIGLAGIYLNIKGREKQGIVRDGEEASALRKELVDKLGGLKDSEWNKIAITSVYDSRTIYNGAYIDQAPDLIVGYNEGYRISWGAAIGQTTDTVFEDNTKNWSGDHGIDPKLVPGVLFSNQVIRATNPNIADMAPTILDQFGIRPPAFIDGKVLEISQNGKPETKINIPEIEKEPERAEIKS